MPLNIRQGPYLRWDRSSDQYEDEEPYIPQAIVVQETPPLDFVGLIWRLALIGGTWWLLADALKDERRRR